MTYKKIIIIITTRKHNIIHIIIEINKLQYITYIKKHGKMLEQKYQNNKSKY